MPEAALSPGLMSGPRAWREAPAPYRPAGFLGLCDGAGGGREPGVETSGGLTAMRGVRAAIVLHAGLVWEACGEGHAALEALSGKCSAEP
eukprot:6419135-Alexandrium_andersonii.AAC.1